MSTQSLLNVGGAVLAAVDTSPSSEIVCEYAVWAAKRLDAALEIVHVLDRHRETAPVVDLSGSLELGAHEALLEELVTREERVGKHIQGRGRLLLQQAKQRAELAGAPRVGVRLRSGSLEEALTELEEGVRVFVVGKRGETEGSGRERLGANLERVVRALHRPILVTPTHFKVPERALIAFDGSATTRKVVEMVAESPAFHGLDCVLLTVGAESDESRAQRDWARSRLTGAGIEARVERRQGDADAVIPEYVRDHAIDLLVMGAYGHSRIRSFVIGSTTTTLLRTCDVPMLLLR